MTIRTKDDGWDMVAVKGGKASFKLGRRLNGPCALRISMACLCCVVYGATTIALYNSNISLI